MPTIHDSHKHETKAGRIQLVLLSTGDVIVSTQENGQKWPTILILSHSEWRTIIHGPWNGE